MFLWLQRLQLSTRDNFKISHKDKDIACYRNLFIILVFNLDPDFLCCGGWAYSALGAFALSCPLCLHSVFYAEGLLGPLLLSLPVFASGGWGVSVASTSVFHVMLKQTLKCWVRLVMWSVCAYLWFFFFLAWLICMLLAGSCPNRGCHLIKSIICWLNLLELRRKRSVHTFSPVGLFLFCVSLIHWFANEVYPTKFPVSCHKGPCCHILFMEWPVWQNN